MYEFFGAALTESYDIPIIRALRRAHTHISSVGALSGVAKSVGAVKCKTGSNFVLVRGIYQAQLGDVYSL